MTRHHHRPTFRAAAITVLAAVLALIASVSAHAAPRSTSPYQTHAEHCQDKGLASTCTLTNIQEQCTTNGCMVAEAFIWARTGTNPAPAAPARGTKSPGKKPSPGTTTTPSTGSTPPSTSTTPSPAAPTPSTTTTTPTTTPTTPAAPAGLIDNSDLLKNTGAASQCQGFRGKALDNCKRTGSPATGYPLSAYQFDITIDVGTFDVRNAFHYSFQWMILITWMLLLMGVRLVLVFLDWGFTLSVLTTVKGGLGQALGDLHARILAPWLPAALAVLALWGIWRGMVQRKAGETLSGVLLSLAAVVAVGTMMVNPQGTVLKATKVADDAGFALYGAFNGGKFSASTGRAAFGEGQRNLWTNTVDPVWCLMQFGSTEFCGRTKYPKPPEAGLKPDGCPEASGGGASKLMGFIPTFGSAVYDEDLKAYCKNTTLRPATMKDLWLSHQGNSKARTAIAKEWKDKPETAQAMDQLSEGGTLHRGVLLLVLGAGLIGAILFFGVIAARLIQASLLLFILILFAPVMALVACAGDGGRKTFMAWCNRLLGAALAKFLWAGVLGVSSLAASLIATANRGTSASWFFTAFLSAALWWTLFLRRDQIMGWMGSDDRDHQAGLGNALQTAFYAQRLAGTAGRAIGLQHGSRALRAGVRKHQALTAGRREQRRLDSAAFAMTESLDRARETEADTNHKKARVGAIDRRMGQLRNAPIAADQRAALAAKNHELSQLRDTPIAPDAQDRIHEIDKELATKGAMSSGAVATAQERIAVKRLIAGLEDTIGAGGGAANTRKGRGAQKRLASLRDDEATLDHGDVVHQAAGRDATAALKTERAEKQQEITDARQRRAGDLMRLRGEAHALEGQILAAETHRATELSGLAAERAMISGIVESPDRQTAHQQVAHADRNLASTGRAFSNRDIESTADQFLDADTRTNRKALRESDRVALGLTPQQLKAASKDQLSEWQQQAAEKRALHYARAPHKVTPSAQRRVHRDMSTSGGRRR